ncbi:hypothetical protein, partial [Blastopirellula marina]
VTSIVCVLLLRIVSSVHAQAILPLQRIDTNDQTSSAYALVFADDGDENHTDQDADEDLAHSTQVINLAGANCTATAQAWNSVPSGNSDFVPEIDITNSGSLYTSGPAQIIEYSTGSVGYGKYKVLANPAVEDTGGTMVSHIYVVLNGGGTFNRVSATYRASVGSSWIEITGNAFVGFHLEGVLSNAGGSPIVLDEMFYTAGINEMFIATEYVSVDDEVEMKASGYLGGQGASPPFDVGGSEMRGLSLTVSASIQ